MLKSVIFYSMILYLMCAYFLIMLPLPSIEAVSKMTGPKIQLTLFRFIKDIIVTVNFDINSLDSLLKILKKPTVSTVIFNLILTLPFGVYLRYYFKKKWHESIFYTFLLSLFFELTQLSGLYGIYPRPYRMFDVDDLLINSLGGLIGHIITPIFTIFFPTRDELEEKSYQKGTKVTLLRRFTAFLIDLVFLSIFFIVAKILFYGTIVEKYYALITVTIYYMIVPNFFGGKTIGKKMLHLKLVGISKDIKWYQIFIRNFFMVYFFTYPVIWINILMEEIQTNIIHILWILIGIFQLINIVYYIMTFSKDTHMFLYEKISNTKNISIIDRPAPIEEKQKEKNANDSEDLSKIMCDKSKKTIPNKIKKIDNCKKE